MRRRTAGFTVIELVVGLAGVGVLLVSGLTVALWVRSASLHRRDDLPSAWAVPERLTAHAVLVVLLSGALGAGVAVFRLIPARWAEEPGCLSRTF